jgi:2-methylaconitate cis-trans-isomerase PrpF
VNHVREGVLEQAVIKNGLVELFVVLFICQSLHLDLSYPSTLSVLESIRQKGAERMGLDPSTQAQPKIAILSPSDEVDNIVHAISMGAVHKAVPMTVGLCLGVAANVKDTLPWTVARMSGLGRREGLG